MVPGKKKNKKRRGKICKRTRLRMKRRRGGLTALPAEIEDDHGRAKKKTERGGGVKGSDGGEIGTQKEGKGLAAKQEGGGHERLKAGGGEP